MSEIDLSIIVPVYRCPAVLLRNCVESIRSLQGLRWELILVDDASGDHCPALIGEYAAQDARIRAIYRSVNGRAGQARNDGLAASRGQYIWFVDADDRILPAAALANLRAAQSAQADIVQFAWEQIDEEGALLCRRNQPEAQLDFLSPQIRADFFHSLHFALWNKFYRRGLLSGLRFRSFAANIGEDTLFNIEAACLCEKLLQCSAPAYQYRIFAESASRRGNKGLSYLQTLCDSQRLISLALGRAYGAEGLVYADFFALKRFVTGLEWIAEHEQGAKRRELRQFWKEDFRGQLLPGLKNFRLSARLFQCLWLLLPGALHCRTMRFLLRRLKLKHRVQQP